ncbi:zinc fingers and homeoboxes protein 2-like [Sinocyclocheilus rhinocerous]|uniref:Zinc fingers and homeoboxes protein 2-like n=1 Tax=Sinocyclocheilus rhinocerous TaxID=307959 RepID=A0A673KAA0_9TELE|nr:PREDICTED: zinc fingers and homeoboxes protein 2-like [Sinocyclocheilus rhinocerous]XP_016376379.1 PREDICTED: zinc fingers and homeoboxes protein 2-like [Sinocyclocheilus rhinocerous]XP_016376384.1 PREDICTED: zinc fingers and homeoboxes protein 2-like [Sinocyclocheilus rhinocerous]XP_016376392.1 PREDICTED: zinc fingers and homeoboxes protein 2-like [Sinocyclocheilus rhinocerous]XP_016376401.1 PREDICTED: zinc fingers and homeoboxes protein 2-like [Sinocyclocheilus rhinocerous]
MASRRKSTTPCMIRPDDLVTADDPEEMDSCVDGPEENGCSHVSSSEDWMDRKSSVNSAQEATELEKPEVKTRPQRKLQGGYECKYCPFSTQNLNEFKDHVDSNHPNVILNPLYLCAVCNFNTKKFDSLTEHNEKCHPGESNFKFKRIKLNSQTILEQTIEGSNCAVIYDTTSPQSGDDFTAFPLSKSSTVKVGKPKADSLRLQDDSPLDKLAQDLPKKQITAVNVNGTVIIPDATIKDGLSHIMPSLQRPPNYNLVPKIAVPLNTSKYNPSLDGNLTLITSFNKFPYPTQAELSWLTAASKHPEEQIKVWFTTQRLKQGISWSPEEVEEARKKMFNGTIQPVQQAFTVLPAQLTQSTKASQPLIQTVPCHVLGQSGLVLAPVSNGSTATGAALALTVTNQIAQGVKRAHRAPLVAPEIKRPSIIQSVQSTPKSVSPTPSLSSDCEKTPDQIRELTNSYAQCQFPDDEEVYRLTETTGLSWGEIKKWFSDQRHGNHKAVQQIKTDLSLKDRQPHKPVATQFPLLERVKGKSSEQMKKLEESFQRTSFPTQAEIEHLVADTMLSKTEIDCWFTERRALRDNLEQALLNSMGSKRLEHHLQRGTLNGVHEQDSRVRDSPLPILTSSVCPEAIDGKSLCLLKDMFAQTQWPSPEEYNQLEIQTGLARTEIVRWFKDNRSALKNGTLGWMEQFQSLSNKRPNGQNSSLISEQAQSVLQRHFQETKVQKGEGFEKLAEQSKLTNQDIVEWFTSKLGHNMPDISKSKDQHGQASVDGKRWVSLAADIEGKDYDAQKVERDLEVLSAEHRVTG